MIVLYTDGAAKGNPGPGGYGVVLKFGGHRKELSEGFRRTTNNRMELLAVIRGLQALKTHEHTVTVYSDSKYVVDAINKGWLKNWVNKNFKGKKNIDLWKLMIPLLAKYKVVFEWVKGHAGIPENERCDELAVAAAEQSNLPADKGYEAIEST
jgi:ribonuclease HI